MQRSLRGAQSSLWRLFGCAAIVSSACLAPSAWADTGAAKVRINVRAGMGTDFPVVLTLSPGQPVDILEYDGEFVKVRTAGGNEGYLKQKFLDIVKVKVAVPEPAKVSAPVAAVPVAVPAAPAAPASTAVPAAVVAAPAVGSDDAAVVLNKVQVTGSRLKRTDIEGASPVIEVSRSDIERIGLSDLGDVIRQLPVVTGSPLSTRTNNGGDGSTSVDLRGVGRQRTLVLINGRRDIAGNDFSTIPLAIVERIEILPQGASAVYGADAVAGVVNIVTRQDMQGLEISGHYSVYPDLQPNAAAAEVNDPGLEGSDGENYRASIVIGNAGKKGKFVAGMEYNRQNDVFQGNMDKPYLRDAIRFTDLDDVALGGASSFNNDIDGDGDPGMVLGGSSAQLNGFYNVSGSPTFDDGIYTIGSDGNPRARVPEDAYNFGPVNYLQTPFLRNNFFFAGDFNLENGVSVYSEARYARRRSEQALAPLPYFSLFDPPGTIPAENFYNPFGTDLRDIRRRVSEVGGRKFLQEQSLSQLTVGARGELPLVEGWDWDAFYQYGRYAQVDVDQGQFVGSRLALALGPSFQDTDGTIRCGTSADPIADCVPLNMFGPNGSITQEMLAYVSANLVDRYEGSRNLAGLTLTGPVMSLPAGDLTAGLSFETRSEYFSYEPDSGKATEAVTGNAGAGLAGSYDVDSVSIEALIPLVSGMPMAQALELGLGFRFDDYSTVGSNEVVQANLLWQPVSSVIVRASYAEVFREPSIFELFAPQGDNFPEYVDPCSNSNIDDANENPYAALTPEQQQRCHDDGVPVGGYFQSNIQPRGRIGGNPNVRPEQGDTFNVGLVWDPEFVPGGSVTLDYFSIELEDAITNIAEESIVKLCIEDGDAASCALTTRFDDGQIDSVVALNQNIGKETATGWDLAFNHRLNGDFGELSSRLLITKLDERASTVLNTLDTVGKFNGGENGFTRGVYPEYKANFILDWSRDRLGASLNIDYIGSVDEVLDDDDPAAVLSREVESVYYLDGAIRYNVTNDALVTFGINNILDEDAPFVAGEFNAQTDTDTYRVLGRQFYLSTRLNFN